MTIYYQTAASERTPTHSSEETVPGEAWPDGDTRKNSYPEAEPSLDSRDDDAGITPS